jgi:hypothetical protein
MMVKGGYLNPAVSNNNTLKTNNLVSMFVSYLYVVDG